MFHSDANIECAAKGFIDGFWYNSDYSQFLRIAIGTNNSAWVDTSAGQDWGNLTNRLSSYASSRGFDVQLFIRGASDLEPGFSSKDAAGNWAAGYSSVSSVSYYNYGSADGCPASGTGPGTDAACNNGWSQSDVAYVSWGNPRAWPLPEIYRTDGRMAYQWQQISVYAYYNISYGRLDFVGSMTQRQACQQNPGTCVGTDNIASQGWRQLHIAANSDTRTAADITYSTDIRWDP